MKFTVVGASGFIGGALARKLDVLGHEVFAPARGGNALLEHALGHVIYAAGITADFRSRPFDTLRANTTMLAELLEHARFDSFLYLSSARLYRHVAHAVEDAAIPVRPTDPEDLYDLTKLTSESLCHASTRRAVRIVRLSNVVGADFRSNNFLSDMVRSACGNGVIELRTDLDSAKDYVCLHDVVDALPEISMAGSHTCYNLAAGANLTHRQLIEPILAASGARLIVCEDAPRSVSPIIDISRLRNEFAYRPSAVLPLITELVREYRKQQHVEN